MGNRERSAPSDASLLMRRSSASIEKQADFGAIDDSVCPQCYAGGPHYSACRGSISHLETGERLLNDPWRRRHCAMIHMGGTVMQFKDLTIGQPFRFERELSRSLVGMKTGEAVKSGRKKYHYVKDNVECRVRFVTVEVVPVASSTTPVRY